MPSSRVETQITWAAGTSVTLSVNNTRSVSDALAAGFNAEDWEADLYVSADNAGTPASGDYVDFYIHYSVGDANGDAADDFATNEYADFLCRLNTYGADNPGENPAARVLPIRTAAKSFKVSCQGPQVASRNIVCRARVITHRPQ